MKEDIQLKEYIKTEKAPQAIGPYSQGIIINNIIYTSGQISIDPKTQEFTNGSIENQTELVINNLIAILEEGGSSINKVIKTTIFLSDMNNFDTVNKIYSSYFTTKPARSTVEVSKLPKNALIEIECIAYI